MAILTDLGVYAIPAWAVFTLDNCVDESLSDEENEMITEFCREFARQGYYALCFEYSAESHFNHNPEFGLPCECYETRVYARAKKAG